MLEKYAAGGIGVFVLAGLISLVVGIGIIYLAPGSFDVTGDQSSGAEVNCNWQVISVDGQTFDSKSELNSFVNENDITFDESLFEFRKSSNNLEYRFSGC